MPDQKTDVEPRGFCPGIFRSFATGQRDVPAGGGPRSAGAHIERAALYQTGAALRDAFFGSAPPHDTVPRAALDLSKAGRCSMALLLLWPSPGILPGLKRWLMIWKGAFRRTLPSDSITCRRFALSRVDASRPFKALELLQPPRTMSSAFRAAPQSALRGLYPVYVRGEAYLAARQGAEAAAEFQKILDHRGIVGTDPIGALARLQLAGRSPCRGTRARPSLPTRTFSLSGKTPTPTSRSLCGRRRSIARLQ